MVLVFSGSDRSGALVARASWQACAIPARVFDSSHRADLLRNLRAGMVSATGLSFLLDDQLPALRANRNLARIRSSALSQKTGALELSGPVKQSGFCLRWSRSCAGHRAWPHDVVEKTYEGFCVLHCGDLSTHLGSAGVRESQKRRRLSRRGLT